MQKMSNNLKGIYRDIIKEPGIGTVYDSGWNSNAIVDQCRMLLAGFISQDSSAGVQYLAVGQGDQNWDDTGIPITDPATTSLVRPHMPPIVHAELDFIYLDSANNPTVGPTNRLEISATLAPNYPPPLVGMTTFPLREFGLFGQYDGTDFMINCIRHPVIHKGATATLIRTVRLFF